MQWVHNGCIAFSNGWQDIFSVLHPPCIRNGSGTRPLHTPSTLININVNMAAPMITSCCPSSWRFSGMFIRKWHRHHTRNLFLSTSSKGSSADVRNNNAKTQSSLSEVYEGMMSSRKAQASCSLLVRLANGTSLDSLLQYCSSQGKVEHHFTYYQKAHYVVVQFSKADTIKEITQKAYTSGGKQLAKKKEQHESRFLSFSRPGKHKERRSPQKEEVVVLNKDLSNKELLIALSDSQSVDEQLELLAEHQGLNEAETRLRFLACSLMEEAFQSILPEASLYPFGSTINGFGRRSCDVDMYLDRGTAQGVIPLKQGRNNYKLSYDRQSANSERVATQSTLFTLAEFLDRHVPQCTYVQRILNARCPLVKFKHQATGLSCDLTGDNRIAMKSSEMLYIYAHLDRRVRPLVFMVRYWAKLNGITNGNPGYWITNYPLTLLVIFFLQTRPHPLLPALDKIALFEPVAEGLEEEERDVDLVFTDNAHTLASNNKETLAELLREFFLFCASFDFKKHALSVHHGSTYLKPSTDRVFPLYIENPLEPELNSTKNVSANLVDRMQRLSATAVRTMDDLDFYRPSGGPNGLHSWGLGALLMGSIQGKGRQRSAAIEQKLGDMFKSLRHREFSTLHGQETCLTRQQVGNTTRCDHTEMDSSNSIHQVQFTPKQSESSWNSNRQNLDISPVFSRTKRIPVISHNGLGR